jgi:hypothetical protein
VLDLRDQKVIDSDHEIGGGDLSRKVMRIWISTLLLKGVGVQKE